jgi:hypothetical protein
MNLSNKDWKNYITKLSAINTAAATAMQRYINTNGMDDMDALIAYAYGLQTKYGEAAGALACQMYEEVARASGKKIDDAEMAEAATYEETAEAINGTLKNMNNTVPSTIGRLVKQRAADTTLKNALRDRAQFAWIPSGDSCAFCMTLASRGWQYMSKSALKGGHAEHIHANCTCEYAISFDENPKVEGYDPDYYKGIYDNAEGKTPKEKINAMRRMRYAEVRGRGEDAQITWSNTTLEKQLGQADYKEFNELVNNSPVKGLYNQYSGDVTYKKTKNKGQYKSFDDTILYDVNTTREDVAKYSTLAHETGHMFDYEMGRVPGLTYKEVDLVNEKCIIGNGMIKTIEPHASNSDEFLNALRKDMEDLKPMVEDKSIREALVGKMTAGIQDALDGFYSTQDSRLLQWGHGDKYYNRFYSHKISGNKNEKELQSVYAELGLKSGNKGEVRRTSRVYEAASEAWANATDAYTNGGQTREYMEKYMPETCKAYLRIVGENGNG